MLKNWAPLIQGLIAPSPVTRPDVLTLTPTGLSDPDGTIALVEFYRDEELLGSNEDGSDGWSWTGSTADWPIGTFTFSARAQDNLRAWSEWTSVSAIVASWQNPANPFDVNGDGNVTPYDVLALINEINWNGSRVLGPRTMDNLELAYFDVTGKGDITPQDVLLLINFINRGSNQSDQGRIRTTRAVTGAETHDLARWTTTAHRKTMAESDADQYFKQTSGRRLIPDAWQRLDDDGLLMQLRYRSLGDSVLDEFFTRMGAAG